MVSELLHQENKKIILETEPEVKPSELFVSASPHAVDKAMKGKSSG